MRRKQTLTTLAERKILLTYFIVLCLDRRAHLAIDSTCSTKCLRKSFLPTAIIAYNR